MLSNRKIFILSTRRIVALVLAAVLALATTQAACAQNELRIRDLCRVAGQETNTLQGVGLVVGLKGTGDGDSKPMARALARMLSLMGAPIASDVQGQLQAAEIQDAKNVALVIVTATVPSSGAQPGDMLDCTVSAVKAKSIEGGQLLLTPLLGPRTDKPTVYALANGPIVIDSRALPTSGKVAKGCKMEAAVQTNFVSNNKFTLILNQEHSSFGTSQYIEDRINEEHRIGVGMSQTGSSQVQPPARAIDPMHIEVDIPAIYQSRPIQFISLMLDIPVLNLRGSKRVVIREREGLVIFGEDVTIAPVAISHKNISINANTKSSSAFVGTSTAGAPSQNPTLQSLVNALNLLSVPTEDVISIIKALKRQGNLYGELVIE
jgi:flagellar P-ring protein precursor FlgI